ncbi:hypothetical protein AYI68_g7867 [Smittium mucronatum]|uniref:Uncharacterized protein n=1 Tax=Smittium mucronatum TaxID=133383 RepID=A0A1R0GMG7_9FUNG|nr:hypothetical protein AYI68_g7867 [Smittium mucronatum]
MKLQLYAPLDLTKVIINGKVKYKWMINAKKKLIEVETTTNIVTGIHNGGIEIEGSLLILDGDEDYQMKYKRSDSGETLISDSLEDLETIIALDEKEIETREKYWQISRDLGFDKESLDYFKNDMGEELNKNKIFEPIYINENSDKELSYFHNSFGIVEKIYSDTINRKF